MVEQSTRFEQAMIGGDPTALLGLCDAKAEGLPGEEGETWAFLRIHFQQDPRRLDHVLRVQGVGRAILGCGGLGLPARPLPAGPPQVGACAQVSGFRVWERSFSGTEAWASLRIPFQQDPRRLEHVGRA